MTNVAEINLSDNAENIVDNSDNKKLTTLNQPKETITLNKTKKKESRWQRMKLWFKHRKPILIVTIFIFLLLLLFFFNRVVISVGPGHVGVLYRRLTSGTQTDYIYPEKLHVILPWNNMYIYDVRIQTILHELTVLTNKGLPITLNLAIRCRPEYEMVGVLHKNVGPDYINLIVIPKIESILRKKIGQLNPEDVYTNKEGILTNILSFAIDEVMQDYIIVEDIIIRSMKLPESVTQAIENKLIEEQLLKKYEFSLDVASKEAERKRIEANGIKEYHKIIDSSLTAQLIRWEGVQATQDIAKSNNAKLVIIGSGKDGIPVILGNQ